MIKMKSLFIFCISLSFIISSCATTQYQTVEFNSPTVLVVMADSIAIEELKNEVGEDDFFTIADDAMWYHSDLSMQLDTTGIEMEMTESQHIKVITPNSKTLIDRDSTFGIYTYFYFDGTDFKRSDVFELLGF